jgi:DNA-directed RNA polymerase specialized sigma24 family protein
VGDQFRKREPKATAAEAPFADLPAAPPPLSEDGTERTATVNRVPGSSRFEAIWDAEWRENRLRTALDRIKLRVNPAHYEMYHLHMVQGLSPRETARALDTHVAAVHLAKHRVGKLLKSELARLEATER